MGLKVTDAMLAQLRRGIDELFNEARVIQEERDHMRKLLAAETAMYEEMVAECGTLRAMLRPLLREPVIVDVECRSIYCMFCRRFMKGTLISSDIDHKPDCPVLTETWAKEED